jgi:hypothetical protein
LQHPQQTKQQHLQHFVSPSRWHLDFSSTQCFSYLSSFHWAYSLFFLDTVAQHDSFGFLGLVSSSFSVEDIVNSPSSLVFGDWGVLGFLCSGEVG